MLIKWYKNMMKQTFGVSLFILETFTLLIPQETEAQRRRYKYIMALGVFGKICSYVSSGGTTMVHLYFVKKEKIEMDISEHLAVIVSTVGIITICLAYPMFSKSWANMLRALTDYSKFGKPANVDETTRFCNRVGVVIVVFFFHCVFLYELANLYESKNCFKLNREKHLHLCCLTMFPVWLPHAVSTRDQILIAAAQIALIAFAAMPVGVASLLPWEVSKQLSNHIRHLNNMFHTIWETDNPEEQRRRLNHWIEYNFHLTTIIQELNRLTKGCVGIVSLVVSIVLALTLNQLLNWNKPLAAIMHLSGWLWSLTTNCITGQKIIDKTESIPVNMWNSNWYKADIKIVKDVQFAMLSAQRQFTLTALPLGTLDMPLLLLLLKSSYSYLTLVTNST
ncbi:uncharacterized protein [Diabrotica undecimpunctata]|uniref:uncharacterized protein n=1 Tax=Diabrotica undecimpunctata TaxID=50387 RepID=UPI003B63EAB2